MIKERYPYTQESKASQWLDKLKGGYADQWILRALLDQMYTPSDQTRFLELLEQQLEYRREHPSLVTVTQVSHDSF